MYLMLLVIGMLLHQIIHFGEGFDWADAPWFDAYGLKDIAAINKSTVLEELQNT